VDACHVRHDTSLPPELRRAGLDRISGFNLWDWLADTKDVVLDRGMMGDGVADVKTARKVLEDVGYLGYCEVEVFSVNNWRKRGL